MKIKIDKGIPIPTTRDTSSQVKSQCHPRPKWTGLLREMEQGDSFLIGPYLVPAILASAHRIGVGTLRRLQTKGRAKGKVRIWRTN